MERIVILRCVAGLLVLAFFAVIVKVSLMAFGTADREAMRIDRAERQSLGQGER